MGYRRADGIALRAVDAAKARFAGKVTKTDGVQTFTHPYGCSQLGMKETSI